MTTTTIKANAKEVQYIASILKSKNIPTCDDCKNYRHCNKRKTKRDQALFCKLYKNWEE